MAAKQSDPVIKINYPGSGNNSQFAFDALNKNVKIVEQAGGSVTSTKQFVWSERVRCEARDASSATTAKYCYFGEALSGTNYYYSMDHLGSTREVTNSSGNLQAQYLYDPFGRVSQSAGSLNSDFQYAGYYYHVPSGLNLAVYRDYNANLAKWLSRDPIAGVSSGTSSATNLLPEVTVGPNLYAYVHNNVTVIADPSGLCDCNHAPPTPPVNACIKARIFAA
jgi:RHS repeat-associated protein